MSTQCLKSFLLTFWYRPSYSMHMILDSKSGHTTAMAVAAIFGTIQFSRLPSMTSENRAICLAACGLGGITGLFLFGWLIRNFGRWFGAETQLRAVRTALGLGLIPWTIIFGTMWLMLNSGVDPELILNQHFPIILVAYIYGFCVLLFSLKAALRLGVMKTFLCLVVTLLFSFFPLTLLAQFLSGYLN